MFHSQLSESVSRRSFHPARSIRCKSKRVPLWKVTSLQAGMASRLCARVDQVRQSGAHLIRAKLDGELDNWHERTLVALKQQGILVLIQLLCSTEALLESLFRTIAISIDSGAAFSKRRSYPTEKVLLSEIQKFQRFVARYCRKRSVLRSPSSSQTLSE